MFVSAFILYSAFAVPLRIGFNLSLNPSESTFDLIVDLLFLLDIIITFNTSYLDESTDLKVGNRKRIAKSYFKMWFWIDVTSTIPFDNLIAVLTGGSNQNFSSIRLIRILRLSRMLKLFRVMKLKRMGRLLESFDLNPALIGVMKLLSQLCFMAHIFSCFWFLVGLQGHTKEDLARIYGNEKIINPPNWIVGYHLHNKNLGEQYAASFYWTLTTMLTIGYGDVHAYNSSERWFSMFTQLTGSIVFGAVIAQVAKLIASRNPQARAFNEKISELKSYLNEKNLPTRLKTLAKDSYIFFLSRRSAFEENGIFEELPPALLNPLVISVYGADIKKFNFFRHLNESFVVRLFMRSKPFQAPAGTVVVEAGDVPDEIMFVVRGMVHFTTVDLKFRSKGRNLSLSPFNCDTILESNNPSMSTKSDYKREFFREIITGYNSEGGYFGDFEYFKKTTRIVSHRAITNCNIISFSTSNFEELLVQYPLVNAVVYNEFSERYNNFAIASKSKSIKKPNSIYWSKSKLLVNGKIYEESTQNPSEDMSKEIEILLGHSTKFSRSPEEELVSIIQYDSHGPASHTIRIDEQRLNIYKRYIFFPDDRWKVFWDLFVGILIVICVIVIPLQIGFNRHSTGIFLILDNVFDSIFALDIVFSLRTAFYDPKSDAYEVIPSRIATLYFRSWFWIDVCSVFPIDLIVTSSSGGIAAILSSLKLLKVLRLVRLLRLARLAKVDQYTETIENNTGIHPAAFSLVMMMAQVMFITHLISCAYWFLSASASESPWFDNFSLRYESLYEQYTTTLYFTLTTVSTVGYGDIVPTNTYEILMVIAIMIFGATVFGYIVANVSSLMNTFDISESRVTNKISEVTEYLTEKGASRIMSKRIIKHFRHVLHQSSAFDEQAILLRLPLHISRKMISYQHSMTLSLIAIFQYIESRGVILFLFRKMNSICYDSGYHIINEGTAATEVVFFTSGYANVFKAPKRHIETLKNLGHQASTRMGAKLSYIPIEQCHYVCDLGAGDFVGHTSMMHGRPYHASVVAKVPCGVYVLSEFDISLILRNFPAVAFALQSAFACAISSMSTAGKKHLIAKRATFIANMKSSFLKKRMLDIKLKPASIPSKITSNNKVSPTLIIGSANQTEMCQSNEPAHRESAYSVDGVMKIQDEKSSDNCRTEATNSSKQAKSKTATIARWNMINALVKDPAAMAIIASSSLDENMTSQNTNAKTAPLENIAVDANEVKKFLDDKHVELAALEAQSKDSVKSTPAKYEQKLPKSQTYSGRAMASMVKIQARVKKAKRLLVLSNGNEFYDSDEDKKKYNTLYALKCSSGYKCFRSCPNFKIIDHNNVKPLKRSLSDMSLNLEQWKSDMKESAFL